MHKFTLIAPAVSNLAFSGRTPEIQIKEGARGHSALAVARDLSGHSYKPARGCGAMTEGPRRPPELRVEDDARFYVWGVCSLIVWGVVWKTAREDGVLSFLGRTGR